MKCERCGASDAELTYTTCGSDNEPVPLCTGCSGVMHSQGHRLPQHTVQPVDSEVHVSRADVMKKLETARESLTALDNKMHLYKQTEEDIMESHRLASGFLREMVGDMHQKLRKSGMAMAKVIFEHCQRKAETVRQYRDDVGGMLYTVRELSDELHDLPEADGEGPCPHIMDIYHKVCALDVDRVGVAQLPDANVTYTVDFSSIYDEISKLKLVIADEEPKIYPAFLPAGDGDGVPDPPQDFTDSLKPGSEVELEVKSVISKDCQFWVVPVSTAASREKLAVLCHDARRAYMSLRDSSSAQLKEKDITPGTKCWVQSEDSWFRGVIDSVKVPQTKICIRLLDYGHFIETDSTQLFSSSVHTSPLPFQAAFVTLLTDPPDFMSTAANRWYFNDLVEKKIVKCTFLHKNEGAVTGWGVTISVPQNDGTFADFNTLAAKKSGRSNFSCRDIRLDQDTNFHRSNETIAVSENKIPSGRVTPDEGSGRSTSDNNSSGRTTPENVSSGRKMNKKRDSKSYDKKTEKKQNRNRRGTRNRDGDASIGSSLDKSEPIVAGNVYEKEEKLRSEGGNRVNNSGDKYQMPPVNEFFENIQKIHFTGSHTESSVLYETEPDSDQQDNEEGGHNLYVGGNAEDKGQGCSFVAVSDDVLDTGKDSCSFEHVNEDVQGRNVAEDNSLDENDITIVESMSCDQAVLGNDTTEVSDFKFGEVLAESSIAHSKLSENTSEFMTTRDDLTASSFDDVSTGELDKRHDFQSTLESSHDYTNIQGSEANFELAIGNEQINAEDAVDEYQKRMNTEFVQIDVEADDCENCSELNVSASHAHAILVPEVAVTGDTGVHHVDNYLSSYMDGVSCQEAIESDVEESHRRGNQNDEELDAIAAAKSNSHANDMSPSDDTLSGTVIPKAADVGVDLLGIDKNIKIGESTGDASEVRNIGAEVTDSIYNQNSANQKMSRVDANGFVESAQHDAQQAEQNNREGGMERLQSRPGLGGEEGREESFQWNDADSKDCGILRHPEDGDSGTRKHQADGGDSKIHRHQPDIRDKKTPEPQPDSGDGRTQRLQPESGDGGTVKHQPDSGDGGTVKHQPESGDGGTPVHQPDSGDGGTVKHQPESGDGGTPVHQIDSGGGGTVKHQPESGDGGTPTYQPDSGDGGTPKHQPNSEGGGTPKYQLAGGDGGTPKHQPDSGDGGTPKHQPDSGDGGTPKHQLASRDGGTPKHQPRSRLDSGDDNDVKASRYLRISPDSLAPPSSLLPEPIQFDDNVGIFTFDQDYGNLPHFPQTLGAQFDITVVKDLQENGEFAGKLSTNKQTEQTISDFVRQAACSPLSPVSVAASLRKDDLILVNTNLFSFCRASITCVFPDQLRVFLLDYGNELTVNKTAVRSFPEQIRQVPFQASKMSLKSNAHDHSTFTPEQRDLFCRITHGTNVTVSLMNQSNDIQYVSMFDPRSDPARPINIINSLNGLSGLPSPPPLLPQVRYNQFMAPPGYEPDYTAVPPPPLMPPGPSDVSRITSIHPWLSPPRIAPFTDSNIPHTETRPPVAPHQRYQPHDAISPTSVPRAKISPNGQNDWRRNAIHPTSTAAFHQSQTIPLDRVNARHVSPPFFTSPKRVHHSDQSPSLTTSKTITIMRRPTNQPINPGQSTSPAPQNNSVTLQKSQTTSPSPSSTTAPSSSGPFTPLISNQSRSDIVCPTSSDSLNVGQQARASSDPENFSHREPRDYRSKRGPNHNVGGSRNKNNKSSLNASFTEGYNMAPNAYSHNYSYPGYGRYEKFGNFPPPWQGTWPRYEEHRDWYVPHDQRECYNCLEIGHIASNCPDLSRDRFQNSGRQKQRDTEYSRNFNQHRPSEQAGTPAPAEAYWDN